MSTEAQKRWYRKNPALTKKRALASKKRQRERFHEFMEDKSCVMCGESDSVVLEWHHTEKNKTDNVGDLLGRKGWDKIMEEVNKCICVCSNCHKKIHYGNLKCDTV